MKRRWVWWGLTSVTATLIVLVAWCRVWLGVHWTSDVVGSLAIVFVRRTTGSAIGSMRNVSVAALTKNLADELGPRGISVTVVHPGLTRTEATPGVVARLAAVRGISEAEAERSLIVNSVRRLIDAEEVAWVVAFLASPRGSAINGDAIVCGGGQPGPIFY